MLCILHLVVQRFTLECSSDADAVWATFMLLSLLCLIASRSFLRSWALLILGDSALRPTSDIVEDDDGVGAGSTCVTTLTILAPNLLAFDDRDGIGSFAVTLRVEGNAEF